MKIISLLVSATLISATAWAQQPQAGAKADASAATDRASANVAGGSEFAAVLSKPVDAGRAKPGDEVTATVSQDISANGQVVVPRGSKLFGRVMSAQAKSGKAEAATTSTLGIVFDRAVVKGGREVPLHATIQAVAAAESAATADASPAYANAVGSGSAGGGVSGGGVLGGVSGSVGTVGGTATGAATGAVGATGQLAGGATALTARSAGAVGGVSNSGRLTAGSKGTFGLPGVDLQSVAGTDAVLTSTARNVRLDSGTRLLLVTGAATH